MSAEASTSLTRRSFVAGLAALGMLPRIARAQRGQRTVAWFGIGGPDDFLPYLNGLQTGLREAGWEEGRNLRIPRFASVRAPDDLEQVVREIVGAKPKPEVVVTQEFATLGMLRFSKEIPVVFGFSGDPVEAKLVKSLARPETSFTGITYLASALVGKRIEFLKEALPGIQRIGILARPQHPGEHLERTASEDAARQLGLAVSYFPITAVAQIEPAFASIREAKCDALVVFPDAIMYRNRELISQLATVARLPAVSGWSSFADSGLLLNYGPNLRDIYVRLASYVDRILRGTPPGELPVDLPRSIELVVNLRTARALGIKISQSVLVRADRVIE